MLVSDDAALADPDFYRVLVSGPNSYHALRVVAVRVFVAAAIVDIVADVVVVAGRRVVHAVSTSRLDGRLLLQMILVQRRQGVDCASPECVRGIQGAALVVDDYFGLMRQQTEASQRSADVGWLAGAAPRAETSALSACNI